MDRVDGAVHFDEEELFSRLMEEFIPDYGDALLRKNAELKAENAVSITAMTYVRCREFIRRQFAAVRRRAAQKALKLASAAACAIVILGGSVLLAVPSLHDAVFGRTETVEPMPLPGQHDLTPAFRRVLPPIPTPTPTPTSAPCDTSGDGIVQRFQFTDYDGNDIVVEGYDAYLAAQREKNIREYYAYMIRRGGDPQKYNYDLNYPKMTPEEEEEYWDSVLYRNRPTVVDKEITHRSLVTRP